eukprot:5105201-Amphidinium_carterae.1
MVFLPWCEVERIEQNVPAVEQEAKVSSHVRLKQNRPGCGAKMQRPYAMWAAGRFRVVESYGRSASGEGGSDRPNFHLGGMAKHSCAAASADSSVCLLPASCPMGSWSCTVPTVHVPSERQFGHWGSSGTCFCICVSEFIE